MYRFGKTSADRLATCHPDLILIAEEALKCSQLDFGIAEGHRTVERQRQLFKEGKSRIDGITQTGKHNLNPSMAIDVFAFIDGKASWQERDLLYLAGVITATAARLLAEGKVSHRIRWGGNWDGDGIIVSDQSFIDLPHFELVPV